jgi:hypothetical protein
MSAGDWIKMRTGLLTHPKVVRVASALKADKLRVVGAMFAVWSVFDEHSTDGYLEGYSFDAMDATIGWRGFSAAMAAVGWLESDDEGLTAPEFDEHNSKSAKRRALDASRKKSGRDADETANGSWTSGGQMSACDADKTGTRKELNKRKNKTPLPPCPSAQVVDLYHEVLPSMPRVKLMPATREKAIRKTWEWVLGSTKSDGERRATTAEEALQWLRGYFVRASENDFLMGRTPRSAEHANWRCDLDFLLTDRGLKQVIEKTQEHSA